MNATKLERAIIGIPGDPAERIFEVYWDPARRAPLFNVDEMRELAKGGGIDEIVSRRGEPAFAVGFGTTWVLVEGVRGALVGIDSEDLYYTWSGWVWEELGDGCPSNATP